MLLLLLILFVVANLFLFCCLLFSLTAFNLLPAAIVVFVVASEANNKPTEQNYLSTWWSTLSLVARKTTFEMQQIIQNIYFPSPKSGKILTLRVSFGSAEFENFATWRQNDRHSILFRFKARRGLISGQLLPCKFSAGSFISKHCVWLALRLLSNTLQKPVTSSSHVPTSSSGSSMCSSGLWVSSSGESARSTAGVSRSKKARFISAWARSFRYYYKEMKGLWSPSGLVGLHKTGKIFLSISRCKATTLFQTMTSGNHGIYVGSRRTLFHLKPGSFLGCIARQDARMRFKMKDVDFDNLHGICTS